MILVPFALFCAVPIGKKSELEIHHPNGHQHVAKNAEGGDAPEESEHQPNAAEEFGADGQEGQRRRDVHLLGEEAHGAAEAEAAEPAESLLRAVRKKDAAKDEPKDGQSEIVGGVDEFAKHGSVLLFLDGKMGFEGRRILQLFCEIARAKTTDGGVIETGVVFEGEFFKTGGGERGKLPRPSTI